MARKALFASLDRGQGAGASISGGSFETEMPGRYMLTLQPQRVAQATGTSVSFTLNLGGTYDIGIIHLQNLVNATSVSVTAGAFSDTLSLPPTGIDDLFYQYLGRPAIFVPPTPVSVSSVSVTVSGSAPLQIGFVGAAEVLEPLLVDILIGAGETVIDESDIETVPYGSTFVTPRGIRRRKDFALGALGDVHAGLATDQFIEFFRMALINGRSKPIMVVPFPDEDGLEMRTYWGLSTIDQQFTNQFFAHHDTTFQITTLI